MQKDPALRYGSGLALADALAAVRRLGPGSTTDLAAAPRRRRARWPRVGLVLSIAALVFCGLALLAVYVSSSAKPGKPSGRPVQTTPELLALVADDLREAPEAERSRRRYLTLTHRHNNPQVPNDDLKALHQVIADLGAHLARDPKDPPFQPLDPARTVYAFDLEQVGWDESHWRGLLKAYPYGLRSTDAADAEVVALAGCPLAHVRADWFVREVGSNYTREGPNALGGPLPGAPLPLPPGRLPHAVEELGFTYDDQPVNLATVIAELGAVDSARVKELIHNTPRLRDKLGLAPLAEDRPVSRRALESTRYATSPFQARVHE